MPVWSGGEVKYWQSPLFAIVFLLGCTAIGIGQEQIREEIALYREAAELQNRSRFELAATVWSEFVNKFPKSQYAIKAQYYEGICHLQSRQLEAAAAAFEKVIQRSNATADKSLSEDAYLNLAWIQLTLAQKGGAKADELFAKSHDTAAALIKSFPTGKNVDKALFYQAESLFLQGKSAQALMPYQRLVRDFPDSPLRLNTLYALGVALEELARYEAAGVIYDLFLEEFPDDKLFAEVKMRKAETVLQEGMTRKGQGDKAGTLEAFKQADQLFAAVIATPNYPSIDHVLTRRAVLASELGDTLESARLYGQVAEQYPDSVYADDATISAGRLLYREKKFDEASQWFQRVVDGKSDYRQEAAHWLCQILLKEGEPGEALSLATRVLADAPQGEFLVPLRMDQADAAYELPEEKSRSAKLYLEIAEQHPDHALAPRALYNAAFDALQNSDIDSVLKLTQDFSAKYPGDFFAPDVLSIRADGLLKRERVKEAEELWRDLISRHAEHQDVNLWRLRFGLSQYLQKDYRQAIESLTPLTRELGSPGRLAEANYLIGASYRREGDFVAAIPWLKKSLEADSNWQQKNEVLLTLAESLQKTDQPKQAIVELDKVIAGSDDQEQLARAHYLKAESLYATNQLDQAIQEYSVVADLPEATEYTQHAIYGLGWGFLRSKQYVKAIESFTRIIDQASDHPLVVDAYLGRGLARRQADQYEKALADFDQFLDSDQPSDQRENARYEKSLCEMALKRYDKAIDSLTSLIEDFGDSKNQMQYRYDLAWAYQYESDDDQSTKWFDTLASQFPASKYAAEANFHVAEHAYVAKRYADAVKRYRDALQSEPDAKLGEKVTYKLGWSLFHLKKFDESEVVFRSQATDYVDGDLALDGQFMIAESLFRAGDFEAALPEFEKATRLINNSTTADESVRTLCALHAGQTANQVKAFDKAARFLSADFSKFVGSTYEAEAWYELAAAHQGLGESELATNAYEKAATLSQGKIGARARCMVGEIAFLEKRYGDAINHYQRVMYGFGGEDAEDDVKKWQAFAGYEAARCNHVQISTENDPERRSQLIDKAIEGYTYVVEEHPGDKLAVDSKTQLAKLRRLK